MAREMAVEDIMDWTSVWTGTCLQRILQKYGTASSRNTKIIASINGHSPQGIVRGISCQRNVKTNSETSVKRALNQAVEWAVR